MLDLLLSQSHTYQNATKETFLSKLSDAFNIFKQCNDTCLIPIKGRCSDKECENCGKEGYSFIGNNSKKHLDLIFVEGEAGIEDIFHCNHLEIRDRELCKEIEARIKLGEVYNPTDYIDPSINRVDIEIFKDEEADFKPDIEYLIKSQKCQLAFEKLDECRGKGILDQEIYMSWLDKHERLFKSFEWWSHSSYSYYYRFYKLYEAFSGVSSCLSLEDKARCAYFEFKEVSEDNQATLLTWFLKFEDLWDKLTFNFLESATKEIGDATALTVCDLNIYAKEFEFSIKLLSIFNERYEQFLVMKSENESEDYDHYRS